MNYCSNCGLAEVSKSVPEGDDRARYVCGACGSVFYQNPKVVAGCLPIWKDQILLCKRAIEPRLGWWTLPAGYMENGETLLEAAVRETREEACARVEISNLFTIFSLPEINQIYVMFLADLIEPDFAPGLESLECKLYSEKQIPWSEIAFPTITQTLRYYFQDLKSGSFSQHIGDFLRRDGELVMRPQLKSDGTEIVTHW